MTIEIKIPDIGVDKVEITDILVKIGDEVEVEQSLITVEGNKASIEIPAPQAGIVKDISVSIGDIVETGKVIMIFDVCDEIGDNKIEDPLFAYKEEQNKVTSLTSTANNCKFVETDAYVHATPLIRRLARELGINLTQVKGTGRKNRILRKDIQDYIHTTTKSTKITDISNHYLLNLFSPKPKVDFSRFGDIEEIKLSRIQKISGANLSYNWIMIPHVTHFDKIDITNLEKFRKQQNTEAEKYKLEVKTTPVVFIMKVVAHALRKMPRFNSSLSEDREHLILKKYINIGIAVDTPNGLVVPVFKDVDKKGIHELSYELIDISKRARDGKLTAGEMQGGCFTISSLGSLGTTYFTPIINSPEVAILGISKSIIEPVWNNKKFIPRLMLPISLSFDHRVIDGADGARFISIINTTLSDIRRLVM